MRSSGASLVVGLVLAVAVGSCGGSNQAQVKTVTVNGSTTDSPAPSQPPRQRSRPKRVKQSAGTSAFTRCDSNIEAKAGTTTCGFAQNVFWQYWTTNQSDSIQAWSPATQSTFSTSCPSGADPVVCTTNDGGAVRFTQAAIDRYSQPQADAYASSHDLGPDPYETAAPSKASPPSNPELGAPSGGNIPSYENGNGYRVQCQDGMYSHSGGIQGACSGHGGVK
jgi:hypothetical protein